MPRHTHSDYAIGLTGYLKDCLPDQRKVFYSKRLYGKPSLISLGYMLYFYQVFGPQDRETDSCAPGLAEQGLLDWLSTHPAHPTQQLRLHGDFREVLSKARFAKAMARFQALFSVLKTRMVHEPKFTYYWGLFERVFPAVPRRARRISRARAVREILRKYFDVALCARREDLLATFPGLGARALDRVVEDLTRENVLLNEVRLQGAPGKWYFLKCGMIRNL